MRSLGRATVGIAAAALAAGASVASAKDIDTDDVKVYQGGGQREGRASFIPWSGIWWPLSSTKLAKGWNGTGDDFEYDATSKTWKRKNAQKPVNDVSTFLKYDEYVKRTTGSDPETALLECTGNPIFRFMHNVYGDQKKKYDDEGISYSWWGHCNGWCGAALMEKEPLGPIEASGVRFEVADLKGLLTESYYGVQSDFTGWRYNSPDKYERESRDPGKALLAALSSGHPKPVAEYIAWYEKAYSTTMSASAKASASPSDFKDELEQFEKSYHDNYDKDGPAYKDVAPHVFHKILETVIGRKKLAFVADITANEEVWNHPAFAYSSNIVLKRSFWEGSEARYEWDVTTTVHYATDGVSESVIGVSEFTRTYTYTLITNAQSSIINGEWKGSSVDDHPDFCWLPISNPTGADYGENYKVLFGKILEILPKSHTTSESRAVDLTANGTRASTKRANDKTTTWSQPTTASGDVALTAPASQGFSVAKVKYFEQNVSGWGEPEATRQALTALGESTTSPSFGATARFGSTGKKMVLAYAYDAAGKLLGIDEITLDTTPSGGSTGGGGTTGADDTYEQNDSKATAAQVAAGSFANLVCNDDDWYKVTLASAGSLEVKIDFSHSEGDLDLVLEGPSGQIAKSDSTNNQEKCSSTSLAAGTYFVRVYGYNGAKAKYSLTVTTGASTGGGSTDDSYEPNNDRASASALTAGEYRNLVWADDDWFKVTLSSAGTVEAKIDFRNSEADLDLVLLGPNGNEIAKSESTSDSETVRGTNLAAGTYTVHVLRYSGGRATYSLKLTTTSSTGGGGTTTRTGTVTAGTLNVRSGPGTTYPVVRTLSRGTVVTILDEQPSWYKITWSGAPSGALWTSKSWIQVN